MASEEVQRGSAPVYVDWRVASDAQEQELRNAAEEEATAFVQGQKQLYGPQRSGGGVRMAYSKESFLLPNSYHSLLKSVLVPRGEVQDRIEKLALEIREAYGDQDVHVLCLLKGSRGFFSHLMESLNRIHSYRRHTRPPFLEHYVRTRLVHNADGETELEVLGETLQGLRDKEVLVVDCLMTTGTTLYYFTNYLNNQFKPRSTRIATLLVKRPPLDQDPALASLPAITPDFVGFSMPPVPIVGMGLDCADQFRDLEHVCELKQEAYHNLKDAMRDIKQPSGKLGAGLTRLPAPSAPPASPHMRAQPRLRTSEVGEVSVGQSAMQ